MNRKNKKQYKKNIKRVKKKYGFLPKDYKETLKSIFNAMEKEGVI